MLASPRVPSTAAVPSTALVLAAGLGTRLRPLTHLCAKPALPVAGEPLVARILRWLGSHGVTNAILNLHHRPETIAAAVGDGSAVGLRVRYSWEQPVLGSGGGLARAFSLTGCDALLVVNGDTLTDVDPAAVWEAHRATGALVTMAVIDNPRPDAYGGVVADAEGIVEGFTPRGQSPPGWHFVGVQIVSREAFDGVAIDAPSESVSQRYPALMRSRPGSVRAWRTRGAFDDIGTPLTYLRTCVSRAGEDRNRLVEAGALVHRSAVLDRTVVWDGAEVDADVHLRECIVTTGARVARGSRYHRAIIMAADSVPAEPQAVRHGDVRVWPITG